MLSEDLAGDLVDLGRGAGGEDEQRRLLGGEGEGSGGADALGADACDEDW